MSESEDFIARVIDMPAMLRRLEAFLNDEEATTYEAGGLAHLDCGHVRPINLWFTPGDELGCHICGPGRHVTEMELIETTEFPMIDALDELPVVSR